MTIALLFLLSLLLTAGSEAVMPTPAKSLQSKPQVEFQNGRLSVKAEGVPLKELLQEIEKKSGISVELKDESAAEKKSTVDIRNQPPMRAFREVLDGLNFAFYYSGGRIERVLILPQGAETPKKFAGGAKAMGKLQEWLNREKNRQFKAKPKEVREREKDHRVEAKLDAIDKMDECEEPKCIAALGDAMLDPSLEVKEAALSRLSDIEGSLATDMIKRGLRDSNPEFRIEVLEALAERGDLESLRRALADRNEEVREAAEELLEKAKR